MNWSTNWQFYIHTSLPCNQCGNPGCFIFCAVSFLNQLAKKQYGTAIICNHTHNYLQYEKPLCQCIRKTTERSLLKFDSLHKIPVFLTLLPQARMVTHPGQKLKLCLAAHHGNCTPPRISPSCPFRDRSTMLVLSSQDRSATICFLDGRTRSPPYLPHLCSSPHRWIFALPPMSLPILHLYKAHQRMYFRFWICNWEGTDRAFSKKSEKCPHYLSSFNILLIAKSEKLPKTFQKIYVFDKYFPSVKTGNELCLSA